MVRKTFGIYSDDLSGCSLYIETGDEYIACWCKQNETNTINAFELFTFKQTDAYNFEDLLKEILFHSRLLTTTFDKVYSIWSNENCICIPSEFYNDDAATSYMKFMFGDNIETSFYKNNLYGYEVVAILPQAAYSAFTNYQTIDINIHKYYQLLKGQQNGNEENKIHLVFYYSWFIVSVFKRGGLQLIQRFYYRAPEDALYHVLNICKTYELSIDELKVYISGMIDISSPLYETLRGYLNNFSVETLKKEIFSAEGFHDYPLHYFASFVQYEV
jgi:hypothetical protein